MRSGVWLQPSESTHAFEAVERTCGRVIAFISNDAFSITGVTAERDISLLLVVSNSFFFYAQSIAGPPAFLSSVGSSSFPGPLLPDILHSFPSQSRQRSSSDQFPNNHQRSISPLSTSFRPLSITPSDSSMSSLLPFFLTTAILFPSFVFLALIFSRPTSLIPF